MSKCQMKKYLAGGKAVGGSASTAVASDKGQQSAAFASLLAQREAQDKMWTQPVSASCPSPASQQLVVKKQQQPSNKQTKAADIDMILNGDF